MMAELRACQGGWRMKENFEVGIQNKYYINLRHLVISTVVQFGQHRGNLVR